jgi:enterochelin esterase family protein
MGAAMIPTFAKSLVEEILPQVEKSYHVSKDRNQRAIAGLSMGGAESLFTGINYVDRFAYIGSFSGAFVMWPRSNPPAGDADFEKVFPTLSAKTNAQLKLVWIACGLDDNLIGINRQFKTWLKSKDVKFTDLEVPGYAHVWPLWRQNLTDLAPLLFK